MRIYVANLAKYNEGELVGGWFDLPVEIEEIYQTIFEPHELDSNGQPHGDFAIHDYELPFEISEYEDIENLNKMAEYLQGLDTAEPILAGNYDMGDVISFAQETEKEEYVEDIIYTEDLDEYVQYRLEQGGWQGVKFMLKDINYINDDYYRINGYGNIEEVPQNYHEELVQEIMSEIKGDFLEQKISKSMNKNKQTELER
ncbi:antirestriction protein ArdA [Siminovitchia fortis]|uniref:antirestriction protein ArdA n=1 Tax=Siminovitchia fortis TaxID=254758 RepID=UPI00119F0503|nr:antirestriction protein ArdA [Siminovitchia fortis]